MNANHGQLSPEERENQQRHIAALEAAVWAVEHHRELAELAYNAENEQELSRELQNRTGYTADQCDTIMWLQIQRLTKHAREQLTANLHEMKQQFH
ncbi:hypothetical protein ACFYV7_24595 [Nocardia suismassiliense]|uniref:Uncharacterized protein n=1 Tax=Nocardia suismassiliense TaxID=2077092 RepID=A0ABW6QXK6_9NOCA